MKLFIKVYIFWICGNKICVREGFLWDLGYHDLLISILIIWYLIKRLGSKVPFQIVSLSITSCPLDAWEHSLRSMTVSLEQVPGEACPPDSSCGSIHENCWTWTGLQATFVSLDNRLTVLNSTHRFVCGDLRRWLVFLSSQRGL